MKCVLLLAVSAALPLGAAAQAVPVCAPFGSAAAPATASPAANPQAPSGSQPAPIAPLVAGAVATPLHLPDPGPCPRTWGQHFERYLDSQFSWDTPLQPLITVIPAATFTGHDGFPGGWNGFADQYRSEFLQEAVGKFSRHFLFAAVFHQDEDYYPLGDGAPTGSRLAHSLRHLFITESADHTHEVFNAEGVPATVFSAYVGNWFEPASERTASTMVENIAWGLFWRVSGDMITEFSPEIHHLLP